MNEDKKTPLDKWSLQKEITELQLWSSHYYCPDGDAVELYISNDKSHFELLCFSGIGISKIIIHDLDFSSLQDKVKDLNFKESFEEQCIRIADYFCNLFCEYKP